jgi:hypothetical protein
MLWHIEQEEKPETTAEFVAAFQRREAAIALATMLGDENSSPVGKRTVARRLRTAREQGEVNVAFQVLPANKLGGFGQYYAGCLYQLGLTHRTDDGIDRVTRGAAEDLAQAVQRTLAATPYLKRALFRETAFDLDALERSRDRLTLDAISEPFANEERRLLVELLFDGKTPPDVARRETLTRILALVEAYESAGIALREDRLPAQLVHGPAYFHVLVRDDDHTRRYDAPDSLAACSDYWRQFSLHQFLTQGLEGLLDAVLRVLAARKQGAGLDEIVTELTGPRFSAYLEKATGGECPSPDGLMRRLGVAAVPNEDSCMRARSEFAWTKPVNEWVCEDEATQAATVAARSCLVLAVLYAKWRGIVTDKTFGAVGMKAGTELAATNVLPRLDSWLEDGTTWSSAVHDVVALVVNHHDRVMYSKHRLESCWLHVEDKRLVRDQDYEPYFRSARHDQAVRILVDLGLLSWVTTKDDKRLSLTAAGRKVARRGLEAA